MSEYRVFRPNYLASRFGEMALQLGAFAMMQELGWLESFKGVVAAPENGVVNKCLLKYFGPWVALAEKGDPVDLPSYNGAELRFPDGSLVPEDRACVALYKLWEDQGRGPLLTLTKEHRHFGEKVLRQLGVPDGAWFAVLHVRDKAYLEDDHADFRNADIETYLQAVETVTNAGGWIIRLGHSKMTPLPELTQVVDYAHCDHRSEEMDVFLLGAARFFLGTTSGPWIVADHFGVPVAQANVTPFSERPFSRRDIYIPKFFIESGEPVGFEKALSLPLRHDHAHSGEVRDNTAEEIVELVEEMLELLDDKAAYTEEDEDLQGKLNKMANEFESHGVSSRMGRGFLRRHKHLMPSV